VAKGHTDAALLALIRAEGEGASPDSIPVRVGDPNNDIDPDDRAPAVIPQFGDVDAPPPMPANWWVHVTLDPPDSRVSSEDVRLVFWYIQHRLAGQEATTGAAAPPPDGKLARLSLPESQNSGQPDARALLPLWNENLAFPETVGQLHEAIENLGPDAWSVFVGLWQTACEIQEPAKHEKHKRIPACAPILAAEPDTPLPPLPADAPVLEEGLHRELEGMPVKVQAFFLHSPKDPPAWRIAESEGERAERQALENLGAWTG
jgi:hypothetical protein